MKNLLVIVAVLMVIGCQTVPGVLIHSGTLKSVTVTTNNHWLNGESRYATVVFEDGYTVVLSSPPETYQIGGEYDIYKKNNGFGDRYEIEKSGEKKDTAFHPRRVD